AWAGIGTPVLGALPRAKAVTAPSRHLGLVPAAERDGAARRAIARLAALVTRSVDLDAVISLARQAGPLSTTPWDPASAVGGARDPGDDARDAGSGAGRPVVAVAGGAAFTFCYTETVELLTAAGASVLTVDPLRDEALPAGTRALVLGGGFPEVHAGDLSANEPLRADVARLARSGAPVVAECAGLLYLAAELDRLPMRGVPDATARMPPRLTLGYREAVAVGSPVPTPAGTAVRGHEFHRTTVVPGNPAAPAWTFGGKEEGFVRAGVHASYLHLHWAGYPGAARRIVAAAGMRHAFSATSSETPQPPGRTPHEAPLRCPGGEDPPSEASEAPAREAMK